MAFTKYGSPELEEQDNPVLDKKKAKDDEPAFGLVSEQDDESGGESSPDE
jgi:hypothetical protein